MAASVQTAACHVHKSSSVDVRLLHEHHVHPRGYGGEDTPENTVWLCGSCHTVLHSLAHYINTGKRGLASDLSMQYQTMQNLSPAGRQRLLTLANTVAQAMKTFDPEFDEDDEDSNDTVIVQLRVQRKLHKMLKVEASKYTNPKSGRQMGLYNYIGRILENHIRVAVTTPMKRKDDSAFYGNDGVVALADDEESSDIDEEPTVPLRPQGRLIPLK